MGSRFSLTIITINITKKELGLQEYDIYETTDIEELISKNASPPVILEKTKWDKKDLIIQLTMTSLDMIYDGYQLGDEKEYSVDISVNITQNTSFIYLTNNKSGNIQKYEFDSFKQYDLQNGFIPITDDNTINGVVNEEVDDKVKDKCCC